MKTMTSFSLITIVIFSALIVSTLNPEQKIDINSASRRDLETISGVGPSLASRIIYERNLRGGFRSLNDLLKIRGIGRKTLMRLQKYLYVAQPELIERKVNHD